MAFRFPQPGNEDDFELFCLRFLRELWKCPTLQQYGKRGERQYGIDLIDEAASTPFRAVQCKHHEADKTIPPAEIEAEVVKAIGSGHPLEEYYILTTGRKSTQAQNAIIRINREHAADRRFKVFVWTWADIETHLSELDDMTLDRVLRGDTGRSGPAIARMMAEVLTGHFDRPLYATATAIDAELETIEGIIQRHELEVGEAKLKELETRGCHALASALRQEFPHVVRLAAIWVRTSPPDVPLASLVEVAAPLAKDDDDLNLALAHRALVENRVSDALSYARRASELHADSPQASFILGMAKHAEAFAGAAGIQSAHLREAADHYDRAVHLAHEQKISGLEAAIRLNREGAPPARRRRRRGRLHGGDRPRAA